MNNISIIILLLLAVPCRAQTPEDALSTYFDALATSNKELLIKVVDEPSAARIGKSIIAASPMFHRSNKTEFFEMIFDRVPTAKEIEAMSPLEAFAEYMCDPVEAGTTQETKRKILGTVAEDDSTVHVVYRVDGVPNLAEKSRDVVTCLRQDGQWRVVISSRVLDAYMSYMLQPAMTRLSDENSKPSY